MWVNHWQTAVTAAVKVTLSCQVSALDTSDHDINTHCSSEPKHARVQRIKWTVLLTGSIQAGNWRAVTVKRNVALICSKGRSWKYAAAPNIFHRLRDSLETSSTNDAKKMVLVFRYLPRRPPCCTATFLQKPRTDKRNLPSKPFNQFVCTLKTSGKSITNQWRQ